MYDADGHCEGVTTQVGCPGAEPAGGIGTVADEQVHLWQGSIGVDPQIAVALRNAFGLDELQVMMLKNQQQHNGRGQQNQKDSSGHPIDKDAIANYADEHAEKGSLGKCAAYCRRAFEAGGVDTSGHPIDAKDWGPTLLKNGATVISTDDYTPSKADVAVFNGSDAHPHGHIAIYDGKQWVSDFKQRNMSPYRTGAPPVTIYRYPTSRTGQGDKL